MNMIAPTLLDLRGLINPASIIKLQTASHLWRGGQTIRVVSDDAAFAGDFLRWCAGLNIEIIALRYPPASGTEVLLRKPGRLRRLSA
jgi:TusA-related sulfurtransferase